MDTPRQQNALSHPEAIGNPCPRVDGPQKVSGMARYAADFNLPGMLHGVLVGATIAHGRIAEFDASQAEALPGVQLVLHRANCPPLKRAQAGSIDEKRPPLEDDVIRYYGQYVALVVADTLETATAAARLVKVRYEAQTPDVSAPEDVDQATEVESERGDAAGAYASAPVRIEATYSTPVETHNPIELHACLADYNGQGYTLYETSQAVVNHRDVMAQMLGVKPDAVRVISLFLGSGFGGKLWPWPHSLLAAAASLRLRKPVKVVLQRAMAFQSVGHRPFIRQRFRLGATQDGKLVSVQQHYISQGSQLDDYQESCVEATPHMYSVPNLKVCSGIARRHVGAPTSMRGPGAVPGLFALESAMDELAVALDRDPVALRLLNEPEKDEGSGLPFSSRHLTECLRTGAERFGWSRRTPQVGSMKQGDLVLGWGMASCSWLALRLPAEATVTLHADGSARVVCATQDLGTGTYTVLAQLVSAETGIPLARIDVRLGDTVLPPGPFSGGSGATASVIPAVLQATREAVRAVIGVSTRKGGVWADRADGLSCRDGAIGPSKGADAYVPLQDVLRRAGVESVSGRGKAGSGNDLKKRYSINSYGAHFAEVTWHPATARLRVSRVVTVIDGGRIVNPRTGRNQIEGAVIMGVGMALFEQTEYDARSGAPVNSNLADYVMTTHADAPELDVTFLDYPDLIWNELGSRGIGEIGLAGIAAAITNAVHHATGVRVRDLPVKIEDLLEKR
ncbi:xanthine dehydrogenase yagR molybdenum binding subunit [Bordetella ansorpii]|uniref:Xanthine dehydrogenase yagR molybdenum binding subunit n=1 Tax=Bordetella ansorpii TaxID=288768 RepID=A0A157QTS8_9BORD|nr:xanthine dehydrogenase family protein molybdopterin-binding subunit [Bordetella ansorpii]SAI49117.1 xanthine dehydrogenase yagR molybdenum binding subunit [Bordetella ansorpii]